MTENLKLQDIKLKTGEVVTLSWARKMKCPVCHVDGFEAALEEKLVMVEITGLFEFRRHTHNKKE